AGLCRDQRLCFHLPDFSRRLAAMAVVARRVFHEGRRVGTVDAVARRRRSRSEDGFSLCREATCWLGSRSRATSSRGNGSSYPRLYSSARGVGGSLSKLVDWVAACRFDLPARLTSLHDSWPAFATRAASLASSGSAAAATARAHTAHDGAVR